MRQYFIDKDVIVDAYATLPLYGLDELGEAITWAKDLKSPITYGRMDSAAGGAGTYASLRPKAGTSTDKETTGKRPRKQKAAAAGEKIEDIAATVVTPTVPAPTMAAAAATEPTKRKPGRPRKVTLEGTTSSGAGSAGPPPAAAPITIAAKQAEAEERRAKRRALLGIGR